MYLVVAAVALFFLLTSLRGIAGFYTDFLWFDSLGFSGVFSGVLGAKVALAVIFTGLFFVLLLVNLLIADRIAPRFHPLGPDQELIERYRELVGGRVRTVQIAVSAALALIAGGGVSGEWNKWVLFTNSQSFGTDDAQFGTDVGFYVFRLPFLNFVSGWLFGTLAVVLVVTAAAHYLNGGIRTQGQSPRVGAAVKGHLSVLLGLLALIKAADYWLARFELTYSTRGVVQGATYTDVKAQLPALTLLILISLAAFALLIVNIWRRGWVLPVLAVGLWAFVALVVGTIYPAVVQRFSVQPSESSKEAPYISRNIDATRLALDLVPCEEGQTAGPEGGCSVEVVAYEAASEVSAASLSTPTTTASLRDVRLWDQVQLLQDLQRLQTSKPYYEINDVSVDRYTVTDASGATSVEPVEVGVRSLNTSGVPQNSWEARHLAYTHGYGVVAVEGNKKTATGQPTVLAADIPQDSSPTAPELQVDRPQVYIGTEQTGYVVVGTKRQEIDYQDAGGTTQFSEYEGENAVSMGSLWRRAAFSLRFGDINPLISGQMTSDSKILYIRDVSERVQKLAPFLSFDADPYLVVLGGELVWVVDGYTTTDRYPYAQQADTDDLSLDSGLDHSFNYARNSVKAVVDAYDGTATFYVVDDEDPIIAAYQEAFPELFTPGDEVPEGLQEHFRYPEDLFRVQTNMWGRYHIADPDDFYNQSNTWNVAQNPAGSTTSPAGTDAAGNPLPTREARIDPAYQLVVAPGDTESSFVIQRSFVPYSDDDSRKELTAYMTADSDPATYGRLRVYEMPSNNQPAGPAIAAAAIRQDEEVSRQQTLLGQSGSQVQLGALTMVPIDGAILYVQSFYVVAETTQVPELKFVMAYNNGRIGIGGDLQLALEDIFPAGTVPELGQTVSTDGAAVDIDDGTDDPTGGNVDDPTTTTVPDDGTDGGGGTASSVEEYLTQAQLAFDEAAQALRDGDLATYQAKVEEAEEAVARAAELAGVGDTSSTTVAPVTTTTRSSTA